MELDETCIDDLLTARAVYFASRPAIAAPGRLPLTCAELAGVVFDARCSLNALGLGRGDRIAIVLPNGSEMAVAFLAVASAAAAAPLNPAYKADEFDFYLSDLQAAALVTLSGWETPARAVAVRRGIPVVELVPGPNEPAGAFDLAAPAGPLPSRPDLRTGPAEPEDIALILHTSGTTSRPKMVPLTGANLCASAGHIRHTLALIETDRCLNVMPLFHIHGLIAALLASLSAGACMIATPGFDPRRFFDWMAETHPTWYTAVPTMHQSVLGRAAEYQAEYRAVIAANPLRFVRSSSASLPPQVMAELEQTFSAPVIEAYGMTEAAHQMASNPLPPAPRKPGSVGLPAGPEIAILDAAGEQLPQGERGEICIRGPNVTAGYQNNPAANAAAYTNGWFRTGDQGFLDPDGYLFITGRLKEIINRGGEKVTPREVDEILMDHPTIAQAVTFAVRHPTLGEDVAAAVVLKAGASADPKDLRAYALDRLSAHKVPSQIVIVDTIPKGPTGKLQRIGLADLLAGALRPDQVAPRTETESLLAELWQGVLGARLAAAPGVYDNFFAGGGDSLLATALIARICSNFQIDLPLGCIFRCPTIAEQAELVEAAILASLGEPQTYTDER